MLDLKEQINLAHTYAILGQIQGLLEAWLGVEDPPVAEIFDRGGWDILSPSQQDRLVELFDQIPTKHVREAIRQAKLEEERTGIPMFEHGGSYWPVFFYQIMIADMSGSNARQVLPQVLSQNRRYVYIGQ